MRVGTWEERRRESVKDSVARLVVSGPGPPVGSGWRVDRRGPAAAAGNPLRPSPERYGSLQERKMKLA